MLQIATLNITGMTCSTCSGAIEKLLRPMNGINKANVSLLTNQAVIEFDQHIIKIDDIIEEIEDVGFGANLSSVSKKRDTTDKPIKKHNMKPKNAIIWSTNINAENTQYTQTYFYNITNGLPGIIKIIFKSNHDINNKTDDNLFIYFDKTMILPMAITHLLQSNNIALSDIHLSKAYPQQLVEEKKEANELILTEIKKICFEISDFDGDLYSFNCIKTKFGTTLIESVETTFINESEK
eukprot:93532_1